MKFRTIQTLTSQAIKSLKRTTSLTTVLVIVACVLALSVFTLIAVNLTVMGQRMQAGVELRVYLKDDTTEALKNALEKSIRSISGVTKVVYVSKAEALERLGAQLGDENAFFFDDMPNNPLPASFDVSVRRADAASDIADRIRKMQGVDEIRYGPELVRNLVGALRVMWVITGAVAVLVLVGASMIVSNTIKLSVFARRREIEIMRLVGASDVFILFPFVVEGLLMGILGAGIASAIVFVAYWAVSDWVRAAAPFLQIVVDSEWLLRAALGVVAFGAVVGIVGSAMSVRKHLRVQG
jgi:cell division transport system permease protein